MSRYVFGMVATVVGSNARSQMSLFAPASSNGRVRQWSIFNTSTTAFKAQMARHTNATGVGAGQTEGEYDEDAPPPLCTVFAGHTADGGIAFFGDIATIGAAAGAGIIWTWGESGLVIQPGTANGIGCAVPTGTGQIGDNTVHWDE